MTIPAGPLENNKEASAHDRFLRPKRNPAREMDLTAVHPNRSPVQQSTHRENSEFGRTARLAEDNGSIRGDPSVCPAGSCNQQPMSTYATSPLSCPVQKKGQFHQSTKSFKEQLLQAIYSSYPAQAKNEDNEIFPPALSFAMYIQVYNTCRCW